MNESAIFFGFSFRHHGPHTAFHGLARALADQTVIDVSPPWPSWTPHAIEWRLNWRWLSLSEYRLRPYFRENAPRVIHYFFPENTMSRADRWKRHHRIIATCHQPIDRIRSREHDERHAGMLRGLRASDLLIVQCQSHIEPYRDFFPEARIACVPLGVDTLYFQRKTPYAPPAGRPRILTVGNWLRDYTVWAEVVQNFSRRNIDAEFVVVANRDTLAVACQALGGQPSNVTFLTGLSDDSLLDEYQRAHVFFLPLTDAMANDALLEALAVGTPMVVTDLPATRDYAGDTAIYTPPHDAETATEKLLYVLDQPEQAKRLSEIARARAMELYDWIPVSNRYRTLYRDVHPLSPEMKKTL